MCWRIKELSKIRTDISRNYKIDTIIYRRLEWIITINMRWDKEIIKRRQKKEDQCIPFHKKTNLYNSLSLWHGVDMSIKLAYPCHKAEFAIVAYCFVNF